MPSLLGTGPGVHYKSLNKIGLSMVLRLRQHNIGYTADGF